MPLFDEVLKDVWKQKQAHQAAAVAKRMAALEDRKQRLIDSVVDGRIDKPTYDGQMAIVGTELNAAQAQLAETLGGHLEQCVRRE